MSEKIPFGAVKRYFYKFKVPQSSKTIKNIVRSCIDETPLPKNVKAEDLLRIKRAFEAYRKSAQIMSRPLAEAETALLETGAELGDKASIALLCGARLSEPGVSKEDWMAGSKLLKELMTSGFALSFKVSGDMAYRMGKAEEALKFYRLAIEKGLNDNLQKVECLRNIGHLCFRRGDLTDAREAFSLACSQAKDQKQVSDCHFYLAQLREANRSAYRQHLELAATYGLKDSFAPLGMLLLNYYGEASLAKRWLTLASATDASGESLLGLLDAGVRLNDKTLVNSTAGKIQAHKNAGILMAARQDFFASFSVEVNQQPPSFPSTNAAPASTKSTNRWEF